uniref:Uncharacterized protein n=1 Tax=Tanacetum cinerariifolium TaxID=118510 RepID=A0A6L2KE16_TANCI|nr:hypothetical protein [Tanacetum cinerariifolium]
MRPFGCLVTILNTLDPLGKFDGKVDKEFLVGYSINSKAFRVFNSRTRIVQETLHIKFLESKPNVIGIGPKWMFDIDTLTKSMNYQPVVAGNQPNDNTCIKENLDAGKVEKETVSAQQYVLLTLWSTGSQDPQNTSDDVANAAFDVKENDNYVYVSANGNDKTNNKKHDEKAIRDDKGKSPIDSLTGVRDLRAEFEEFSFTTLIGSNFGIARKSSFVDSSKYPDDLVMPELEDIIYSDDEEDVGVEADLSNLGTNIPISLILTTKLHKDHPVNQIIGDLHSAPQTRSMARMVKEQGGLHQINDEDFHSYLPKGKRAIGLKWIFRNKKDKRGIVIKNKARFFVQGHTQEEGIDYDEVFAPVVRIEAIWLFLACASFMGFMVYQMDVKSAFLYETIKEEVYVYQPLEFEDLDYPDKVYKVAKELYELHQAPRAFYETLANYLLENGFQRGKIDQTLLIKKQKGDILLVQVFVDDIIFGSTNKELCKAFETLMKDKFQMSSMGELTFFLRLQVKQMDDGIFIKKPLLKDLDSEDVDVHIYMLMIRSLMYLTPSRPDIMFAVCAYARFQVTTKVLHLHVVKRIFRSLVNAVEGITAMATVKKVSDVVQLRALIDGKKVVVSEDIIRRDLHLDDADGVDCLPNEEIFAELAQMGYEKPPPKLTFYKLSCSMASAIICLAAGRKFNFSKYIFDSMVRNVDSPSKFLMYPPFLQVVMDNQVDDMTSHNTRYISSALTQKVFANMRRVRKGFSGVETPLFASMLVKLQPQVKEEEEEVKVPITPALPSPTSSPSPPPQDPTLTPHATPLASPPQEQPITTSKTSMSFLTTLMETCASLLQKVAELEQDKHSQALEILQLKKRVKKLEKKKRSKSLGFKRLRRVGGDIEAVDADEGITLVDVETQEEGVSAAEPTVFDDEEVTMTMAQTLIKLKAEKAKLLDEHIAQKLHDEEVQKAAARDKQEKANLERAIELQKQYDDKEENIDWSAVAEQNMDGYKMKYFRRMTYNKVRPIFEREYKKIQTLFKLDKNVKEPKKKRVTDETLLQESFKKLREAEVSVSEFKDEALEFKYPIIDWEIYTKCSRTYWKIIRVSGITEAYQIFEDMHKGFDREELVALWNLVKEKFNADDVLWKLQRYMHASLTWKLYIDCGVHHVSSTRGHAIFMLTEKDYPLSNAVMILMLSGKLQVEKDNEMARDLVMKIFIEANKPKSRSLDTSSK